MALFESYERREKQILAVLKEYGINSIEEAGEITKAAGLDVYAQVEGIQPICFENAKWAYTVGAAIAIKKGCKRAADAAAAIGEGLQAFCIPGSVADQRKVGLGHGNLGKMLLEERLYHVGRPHVSGTQARPEQPPPPAHGDRAVRHKASPHEHEPAGKMQPAGRYAAGVLCHRAGLQ